MIVTDMLRELADAIEAGRYGNGIAPADLPPNFIPTGEPRPELGPGEAYWQHKRRTGKVAVHIDIKNDAIDIKPEFAVIGCSKGPK